jgi:eukaryotic-like serine/threonine-protein kinase
MDDDGVTDELLTFDDEGLEGALRAAFGPPSTAYFSASNGGPSFELGPISRIALRETSDGRATTETRDNLDDGGDRGRYQVLGEIARGGMGVVLRGRDPNLGREVALKVLHASHAHNPSMIQRFVDEAQIGGQLQHPGILPIYDFGLDAEYRPFFTMRLVRGRTLAALLQERPQPSDELMRFLGIFEQVCQTIAYAHFRGVVHRDLKPSNIMVGAFGEVQVVDWGLAKVIGRATSEETISNENVVTVRSSASGPTSHQGSVLGTPAYMSPEQARGAVEDLDESTDVFALGACLCEIITGKPPYSGSHREMLESAAAGRIEAAIVRLEASEADGDLVNIAKQCLAPEASNRIRHAEELAHAVREYLTSLGDRVRAAEVAAAEARATAMAERKARRRTLLLSGALGAAVLTGAVFAVRFERERSARVSQSLAEAAALYPKAVWFREQSDSLPIEFLPTWSEALGHVQRTAETIRDGATDERLRKDLSGVVRSLRVEKANVDRRIEQLNSSP